MERRLSAIPNNVIIIEDSAFYGCESLTAIIIGNRITSIEDFAFDGCKKLTSIIIPDSVTSIGEYAFSDCESLSTIQYAGTIAQWKEIELGDGWNHNGWNHEIPTNIVHCTDGDVEI